MHAVKLAINYQLGDRGSPEPEVTKSSVAAARTPGFETELGGRYVYAWTRFQQDLGKVPLALPVNNSRLTWKDQRTNGGELFGRVDTPENVMVKGFIGLGKGDQGHIYDEDWGNVFPSSPPPTEVNGYQVTESATTSKIRYFTLDLGYDWLRGAGYKVASYGGYNYFEYTMSAFGCTFLQFVPPQTCQPGDPPRKLFLQEEDTWISWRLGTSAEVMLTPWLKLSGDVAYLPIVRFGGSITIHCGPTARAPVRRPRVMARACRSKA